MPPLPDDLRDRFDTVSEPPRAAIVRSDFLASFRRLELLRAADPGWQPSAPSPRSPSSTATALGPGRGPLHRIPVPGLSGDETREVEEHEGAANEDQDEHQVVVRPYRRGGLIRHVVEARYFLGDRAFHELEVLVRLRRRGLPVPAALAAVQRRESVGYRAALVTRMVPDVRPLSGLLDGADPERARRLMAGAGATLGRLHAAGGHHADLNAHNLLADPDDPGRPVYLVDLDRGGAEQEPVPRGPARRGLQRLRRSLEKLDLEEGLAYWDELEREYRRNREGIAGSSAG